MPADLPIGPQALNARSRPLSKLNLAHTAELLSNIVPCRADLAS